MPTVNARTRSATREDRSSLRMNRPPVLKISADATSSSTAIGETREPAGTYETATPPSPATAVTLSAAWSSSSGISPQSPRDASSATSSFPAAVRPGQHLEEMAARVLEVEPASAVVVVDLAFVARPWIRPVRDAALLDAGEDLVELFLGDQERVVLLGDLVARSRRSRATPRCQSARPGNVRTVRAPAGRGSRTGMSPIPACRGRRRSCGSVAQPCPKDTTRRSASPSEVLLEPVVGVGLVVEAGDLGVSGRSIEVDRLGQGLVGLEPHDARRRDRGPAARVRSAGVVRRPARAPTRRPTFA